MIKKYLLILMILFIPIGLFSKENQVVPKEDYPGLLDHWGENLVDSFAGLNIFYHVGAIGVTYAMIETGADHKIQNFFQNENPFGQTYADIMIITGNFWHFIPGLIVYWNGKSSHNIELTGAGAASCQAVFTAFLVTSVEKYLSGRKFPNKTDHSGFLNAGGWVGTDDESDFSLKFWDNSINERRVSWPSGHTATAFAFVSALYAYYPEESSIAMIGYPLALLMGISTIEGDYHWGSDVAAGLLIGHIIGWTIGKNYRQQVDQKTGKKIDRSSDIRLMPIVQSQFKGLALQLSWR